MSTLIADDVDVADFSSTFLKPVDPDEVRCPFCGVARQKTARCNSAACSLPPPVVCDPPRGFKSWRTFANGLYARYKKRCPPPDIDASIDLSDIVYPAVTFDNQEWRAMLYSDEHKHLLGMTHPERDSLVESDA